MTGISLAEFVIETIGGADLLWRFARQDGEPGGQCRRAAVQEVGMADQDRRAAIIEHVGDLGGCGMPVEGHHIGAQRLRGIAGLIKREVVARQQGDAVIGGDA